MHQDTTQTCSLGPDDRSLTDTGGGYHIEAPNLSSVHSQSSHSVFSTALLLAPPGLTWSHNLIANINHIEPPVSRGAYRDCLFTTWLLPKAYITKHSHSIILIPLWGGKQDILVRVFLMQLSFHRIPICKCTIIV
jgi:hypothetical protein